MIAVLGSGFGLYGHLTALVELGHRVVTAARYYKVFEARPELQDLVTHIEFAADERALLRDIDGLVLARRPADNVADARMAMRTGSPFPHFIVLEKPMAPSPQEALVLAGELEAASIFYAVPYLLNYCSWARDASEALRDGGATDVHLEWTYASPTVTEASWKTQPALGGGPISFYFIHVLALASMLIGPQCRIERIVESRTATTAELFLIARGSGRCFTARFATGEVPTSCRVQVGRNTIFSDMTPFGSVPTRGVRDPRVDMLKRFYASIFANQTSVHNNAVLQLWIDAVSALEAACGLQ